MTGAAVQHSGSEVVAGAQRVVSERPGPVPGTDLLVGIHERRQGLMGGLPWGSGGAGPLGRSVAAILSHAEEKCARPVSQVKVRARGLPGWAELELGCSSGVLAEEQPPTLSGAGGEGRGGAVTV